MAEKITVSLLDDIDGSEATQTVVFGFEGVEYTIDLNDKNASNLRKILTEHASVARRVAGRKRTSSISPTAKNTEAAKMREWLRAAGHELSDRGRIPDRLVNIYLMRPGGTANAVVTKIAETPAPEVKADQPKATRKAPQKADATTKTPAKGASTRKAAATAKKPSPASNVVEFSAAGADKPAKRTTTRTRKTSIPK